MITECYLSQKISLFSAFALFVVGVDHLFVMNPLSEQTPDSPHFPSRLVSSLGKFSLMTVLYEF